MADFRDFLAPSAPIVLPYFGGTRVDAADRRFHIEGELAPGWWRFKIEGRRATAVEPAPPIDLAALPAVRGHWLDGRGLPAAGSAAERRRGVIDGWIVIDGAKLARVALPPDDEPAPFARVTGRRWYSGDLLFEAVEFEDDAEIEARRAFEERRPIGELGGVVPSLRTAFGLALGVALGDELGVAVTARELMPRVVAIADRGREAVREWVAELEVERARAAAAVEAERQRREAEVRELDAKRKREALVGTARSIRRHGDPVRRADDALDGAKARMLSCRRLDRGLRLDVVYEVDGTRIMSMVDAESLQVIDPGVCLGHDGEYRVLTLDAMPSVVREAIETGRLNITRRA